MAPAGAGGPLCGHVLGVALEVEVVAFGVEGGVALRVVVIASRFIFLGFIINIIAIVVIIVIACHRFLDGKKSLVHCTKSVHWHEGICV